MSEFIYDRDDTTVIVLRVPRRLWDRYESSHKHFGEAIYAVRENVVAIISNRVANRSYRDTGDPFWTEQ